MRKDFAKLSFLYLEAMSITGILYTGSTYFTNRYRPYVYSEETPMDYRTRGGGKNSFYAGHVALVATATLLFMRRYMQTTILIQKLSGLFMDWQLLLPALPLICGIAVGCISLQIFCCRNLARNIDWFTGAQTAQNKMDQKSQSYHYTVYRPIEWVSRCV